MSRMPSRTASASVRHRLSAGTAEPKGSLQSMNVCVSHAGSIQEKELFGGDWQFLTPVLSLQDKPLETSHLKSVVGHLFEETIMTENGSVIFYRRVECSEVPVEG